MKTIKNRCFVLFVSFVVKLLPACGRRPRWTPARKAAPQSFLLLIDCNDGTGSHKNMGVALIAQAESGAKAPFLFLEYGLALALLEFGNLTVDLY
jgi:hypothetical protein